VGSQALAAFGRKVLAVEEWLSAGAGAGGLRGRRADALQRRLEHSCRVAGDEVPSSRRGAYIFATFEALEAEEPVEAVMEAKPTLTVGAVTVGPHA